jgi:hypothetical protein
MSKKSVEDMQADIKQLRLLAFGKKTKTAAKIRAMRQIRKMSFAIYKQEMTALTESEKNEPYILSEEKLKSIVDCMERFGILQKQTIDKAA